MFKYFWIAMFFHMDQHSKDGRDKLSQKCRNMA